MYQWVITKQFDFCYGHRVWSQKLNSDFSLDSNLACRHLHGHQGTILISLRARELKEGMVTDFKHLNWFKKWLDEVLDHKFIIDKEDPVLRYLFPSHSFNNSFEFNSLFSYHEEGYYTPVNILEPSIMDEIYKGLIIVLFVPTSENLSKWIYDIVKKRMSKLSIEVVRVEFYETPKSKSIYGEI